MQQIIEKSEAQRLLEYINNRAGQIKKEKQRCKYHSNKEDENKLESKLMQLLNLSTVIETIQEG